MGIFGGAAADAAEGVVRGVGGVLDELFTSDEERLKAALALEKVRQMPALQQIATNTEAAKHPSIFVAGARPFILWVCGVGLAIAALNPAIGWLFKMAVIFGWTNELIDPPEIDVDVLYPIMMGMLGLGGMRSFEKAKGVARERLR